MADFLPIVSQVKSVVQAVSGDKEGAVRTQYNFSRQCPVVSQLRSLGELALVSKDAAWQTQVEQGRLVNGVLNGIPIIGHAKAGVHYRMGNYEESLAAAKAASRSTAVVGGGLAGFAVGSVPGAVVGAVSAGAAADVTTSVVESRAKGYYIPSGAIVPLEVCLQAEGSKKAGPCFDVVVVLVGDALVGFMVGKAALARQTRTAGANGFARALGAGEDGLFWSAEEGISLFGEDGPFLAGEDGVFLGNEHGPLILQEALPAQDIQNSSVDVKTEATGLSFAMLEEWLMLRRRSRSPQAGQAGQAVDQLMLSDVAECPMLRVLDRDGQQVVIPLHLHADIQQMLAGRIISPLMLQLPAEALEEDEEEELDITILPRGKGRLYPSRALSVMSRAGGFVSGRAIAAGGLLSGGARAAGGFLSNGARAALRARPPVPVSSAPAPVADTVAAVELQEWAEQLLEEGGNECLQMFSLAKLAYEDDAAGFWEIQSAAAPAPDGVDVSRVRQTVAAAVAAASERPTASLRALVSTRKPVPGSGSEADFGVVVELAFRGSANLGNWLANFTCELVTCRLEGGGGKVHSGFQDSYLMLKDEILARIRQDLLRLGATDARVLLKVTGHSLGGALAMLAAYDISQLLGAEARVVTWGSPRPGDREFKECYSRAVRHTARFVNKFDPVPHLPSDPEEPPSNDAEAVSAVVASLLRSPLDRFGAAGFCSVCRPCQLDVGPTGVASSVAHWATLGSMAFRKIAGSESRPRAFVDAVDPGASLVPHGLEYYEANLRKRLGATGVGPAAGGLVRAILTTAVASRVSGSFLARGAATVVANVAADRVATMASPAEPCPEQTARL